jgi:hypothetical protein
MGEGWGERGSELQKSERRNEKRTSKIYQSIRTSIKVIRTSKIKKNRTTTTTYGVLPMDTKACGGLGSVRLG